MRVIKRYSNRKLYDTEDRCYVTLLQVAERLRTGEEVRIVDNKSGDDLTSVTLSQILTESERRKAGVLPTSFLADLVRRGGDRLSGIVKTSHRAMGQARNLAALVEKEVEKRIRALQGAGEISQNQARRLLEAARRTATEQGRAVETRIEESVRATLARLDIPSRHDITLLSARIDELAALLKKGDERRPRRRPAKHS